MIYYFHQVSKLLCASPSIIPYVFLAKRKFCTFNSLLASKGIKSTNIENERKRSFDDGPSLDYFISNGGNHIRSRRELKKISHPYVEVPDLSGKGRKVFFKVYGCQMNSSDTEIAWSVLKAHDYQLADFIHEADVIFIITCAIREGAETKIWRQLEVLRSLKNKSKWNKNNIKIGILGCMAERMGTEIIKKEKIVDIVAGPDSYKDLPRLLAIARDGAKTVNILLSHDETYANVNPVSLSANRMSAFVSIMRGCNNMCSYCIVPFTRGRERSRDIKSIVDEVKYLSDQGIREITLLGQNVNSYRDTTETNHTFNTKADKSCSLSKGFKNIYKNKEGGRKFVDLLKNVSEVNSEMRIRFTSPHPKNFPDELLHVIKERPNICKNIHLPAQSGNNRILELMQRGYTREVYLDLVEQIRLIIPNVALSSDFICGFCSETEQEFDDTLSLMEAVQYNFCFMFPYSLRERTSAHRKLIDDVPQDIKLDRLNRLSTLFRKIALQINSSKIGQNQLVLIEGLSRRSPVQLSGRNDANTKVIIPDIYLPVIGKSEHRSATSGDYVEVFITDATSQVLKGEPLSISSIANFNFGHQ